MMRMALTQNCTFSLNVGLTFSFFRRPGLWRVERAADALALEGASVVELDTGGEEKENGLRSGLANVTSVAGRVSPEA